MKIDLPIKELSIDYSYKIEKKYTYKNTKQLVIDASDSISLLRKQSEKFNDSLNYIFISKKFVQKDVKSPFVFSPISWIWNLKFNTALVDSKDNLKPMWNRYKDKHRK